MKKYAHLTNKTLDEIALYAKELILRMYTEAVGGEQEQLKFLFLDAKGTECFSLDLTCLVSCLPCLPCLSAVKMKSLVRDR